MKKLILLLLVIVSTVTISAQGFFKPIPKDLFTAEPTADRTFKGTSIWLVRPAVTVTAIQWNWDKEAKQFNPTAFNSTGLGIGYQHFVPVSATDPTPYSNYGANILLLLGGDISGAVTFTGLGIINLGVLYNFTLKQPGILLGIQMRFN